MNDLNELITIPQCKYIYRVNHRILEGDCQFDHGPKIVNLKSFSILKYPVTNKMFKIFLEKSNYIPEDATNYLKHWTDGMYLLDKENHPVVWVSHSDANAYAQWSGALLPTDEQWQYAACGENKLKWPWGNDFNENLCNDNNVETTSVDKYPEGASSFGCMDMSGNTWEWLDNIIDDGYHQFALIRGGSFYKGESCWHPDGGAQPNDFHWKFQLLNEGLNRCATIGFRCVKEGDMCD